MMIYKPDTILQEIQSFMTLYPGDIVMTGTPKGVGTYEPGDRFEAVLLDGDRELLNQTWIVNSD